MTKKIKIPTKSVLKGSTFVHVPILVVALVLSSVDAGIGLSAPKAHPPMAETSKALRPISSVLSQGQLNIPRIASTETTSHAGIFIEPKAHKSLLAQYNASDIALISFSRQPDGSYAPKETRFFTETTDGIDVDTLTSAINRRITVFEKAPSEITVLLTLDPKKLSSQSHLGIALSNIQALSDGKNIVVCHPFFFKIPPEYKTLQEEIAFCWLKMFEYLRNGFSFAQAQLMAHFASLEYLGSEGHGNEAVQCLEAINNGTLNLNPYYQICMSFAATNHPDFRPKGCGRCANCCCGGNAAAMTEEEMAQRKAEDDARYKEMFKDKVTLNEALLLIRIALHTSVGLDMDTLTYYIDAVIKMIEGSTDDRDWYETIRNLCKVSTLVAAHPALQSKAEEMFLVLVEQAKRTRTVRGWPHALSLVVREMDKHEFLRPTVSQLLIDSIELYRSRRAFTQLKDMAASVDFSLHPDIDCGHIKVLCRAHIDYLANQDSYHLYKHERIGPEHLCHIACGISNHKDLKDEALALYRAVMQSASKDMSINDTIEISAIIFEDVNLTIDDIKALLESFGGSISLLIRGMIPALAKRKDRFQEGEWEGLLSDCIDIADKIPCRVTKGEILHVLIPHIADYGDLMEKIFPIIKCVSFLSLAGVVELLAEQGCFDKYPELEEIIREMVSNKFSWASDEDKQTIIDAINPKGAIFDRLGPETPREYAVAAFRKRVRQIRREEKEPYRRAVALCDLCRKAVHIPSIPLGMKQGLLQEAVFLITKGRSLYACKRLFSLLNDNIELLDGAENILDMLSKGVKDIADENTMNDLFDKHQLLVDLALLMVKTAMRMPQSDGLVIVVKAFLLVDASWYNVGPVIEEMAKHEGWAKIASMASLMLMYRNIGRDSVVDRTIGTVVCHADRILQENRDIAAQMRDRLTEDARTSTVVAVLPAAGQDSNAEPSFAIIPSIIHEGTVLKPDSGFLNLWRLILEQARAHNPGCEERSRSSEQPLSLPSHQIIDAVATAA